MISPTPGRIVWFHAGSHDDELQHDLPAKTSQPHAAIVAYVWSDTMINVTVCKSDGETVGRTSIYLKQDGGREPQPGEAYAYWMPYQTGQAKKAEAAEAELKQMASAGRPLV